MLVVTRRPSPLNAARWPRTASTQLGGHQASPLLVGTREDHGQLVAAQAREHVGLAHLLPQQLGDAPDHGVAGLVAEAVVDELEVVDVEQQYGAALAVASRLGDAIGELLLEAAPIQRAR